MGIYIELPKDWAKYEIIVTDFRDNELEAKAIDLDLVRCGECKYWHEGEWYNTCDKYIGHDFMAEHFCSDGRRKEEHNDTQISDK